MEIFEKKHPISFAFDLGFMLIALALSVAGLTISLYKTTAYPLWATVFYMSIFAVLFVGSIIVGITHCAEYKHLVIDKKPAIIINDDSITYYAFYSRKYVTFKLEDIKEFKFKFNRMGDFIQPVFKNPELAKKYKYRSYLMHFTIVARIDNLEDGYSNIIYILNHIIDGTYFEDIYKSVKERTI